MFSYLRNLLLCVILVLVCAVGKIIYDRQNARALRDKAAKSSIRAHTSATAASLEPRSTAATQNAADLIAAPTTANIRQQAAARSTKPNGPDTANPFVPAAGSETFLITAQDATSRVAAEMFDALADQPLLVVWLVDRTPSAEGLRTAARSR